MTANIERVANLFITKTAWATLLAVAVGAALLPYPFLPRHLTIIGTAVAGFVLLFPIPAVRRFYELQLPRNGLPTTLAVAALGAAALACFWGLSRRRDRGQQPG